MTTMAINDYGDGHGNVNHRYSINSNDINNYFHNHCIDNIYNAGNANDGNDNDMNGNNKDEYRHADYENSDKTINPYSSINGKNVNYDN